MRETVLDPRGKIHIPIGIPNTLDSLKTFVEAEGSFSPGVGSFGVYFWLFDHETGALVAPTMEQVPCEYGLHDAGYLIPWTRWEYDRIGVRVRFCQVRRPSPVGDVFVLGARVQLTSASKRRRMVSLYAALRPVGPAGGPVSHMAVSEDGRTLLVDGHPAIVAERAPTESGVLSSDDIGRLALAGKLPSSRTASSETGDCSGAMRFRLSLAEGTTETLGFVCPVLPGCCAARHQWVDLGQGALVDLAEPNSPEGGILQPDPGLAFYRGLETDQLFREAVDYWRNLMGGFAIKSPDSRWGQGLRAMLGHVGLCMNESAPDVAVVNYNVYNRDGIYVANMMQKSGLLQLAEKAVGYFLSHPFNGRAHPEADNPGQVLWSVGQQWLFARDINWLSRVYPAVLELAAMIAYYRTAPGPHWVDMNSLGFGESLPPDKRRELKPGRCDGYHPEYTEAFDIAGLRSAAMLAETLGCADDAAKWTEIADSLFRTYDEKFGHDLGQKYGSYSVLWPCRLYPLEAGRAHERFKNIKAQESNTWRYFPLATAHQGLLAGSREAGYRTVQLHLEQEQMRGWYAFDEWGARSSSGGWHSLRTTWPHSVDRPGDNLSVAMPHGWAIAELWLLMRDCLVFEDDHERLVLLAGVAPEWFRHPEGIHVSGLGTYFGSCTFDWIAREYGALLRLSGTAEPPNGFVLRLPLSFNATVTINGETVRGTLDRDFLLPPDAREMLIQF